MNFIIEKYSLSEKLYKEEVDKYPNLTNEEILSLIHNIKKGNEELKNYFILTQQRRVLNIVNKFKNIYKLDFMDLVQEGNMGLLNAIYSFDPSNNIMFSTYSYTVIFNAIIDAINHQTKLIYVSQYNINKYGLDLLPAVTRSLDYVYSNTGKTLLDKYPSNNLMSPLKKHLTFEQTKIIKDNLNQLSSKNKNIVILYFGLYGNKKHTYKEIGKIYKLTKSAIYQKIHKILQNLVLIKNY